MTPDEMTSGAVVESDRRRVDVGGNGGGVDALDYEDFEEEKEESVSPPPLYIQGSGYGHQQFLEGASGICGLLWT